MHIDSDVMFFRKLNAADALQDGRVRFFRTDGKTGNPLHCEWVRRSAQCLGVDASPDLETHYVENCVLWSSAICQRMIAKIEQTHSRPWYQVLAEQPTLSEYYLYGIFSDTLGPDSGLQPEGQSFCLSHWPASNETPYDFDKHMSRMHPKHCALAIPSIYPMPEERRAHVARMAAEKFVAQSNE